MEYRTLGKTGARVSVIGFGASPLGDVFGRTDEAEGIRAVHYAIDHGINYFDVAPMYGVTLAESRLGKALKGKRHNVFLATKCCRYDTDKFDFSYNRVIESIDESLLRLGTDYVDLYQVHDIEFGDRRRVLEEAIPAARKVQQMGKARFVGITGLPVRYLRFIAEQAEVDTILSWAHYNLVEDEMDTVLRPLTQQRGIGLINASPLHQRLLTEMGPPSWHRSPKEVLETGPKIAALCRQYGVNVADVAMRFALDYPYAATTVVGMSKLKHVERNIKTLDFKNDPQLLAGIEELVAPPNGLKYKLLKDVSEKELIEGMEKSIDFMLKSGTNIFCDFREGGIQGICYLKTAIDLWNIDSVILSRPDKLTYDKNEIDLLLKNSNGIGLSSISDWDYSEIIKIAKQTKNKKKIFAIHASERVREDIDLILDLKPDFLVHMVKASESDLVCVKENNIPIVLCPRSNAFFGIKPNVALMKKIGVDILLGTDNAMLSSVSILDEINYFLKNFEGIGKSEILYKTTYGARKALNLECDILGPNSKADFVVLDEKTLQPLYISV